MDTDAERCLLGAIIVRQTVMDDVATIVDTEDFFDESNRALYAILQRMHERGDSVGDLGRIVREAKKAGDYEKIGGAKYLGAILESAAGGAHAKFYADQVRSVSIRRQLRQSAGECIEDCADEMLDAAAVLERMESRILGIADRRVSNEEPLDAKAIAHIALENYERRQSGSEEAWLRTGYADIDRTISGLYPGHLIILAARPSIGKTSLASNIIESVAIDREHAALFVSLEMSQEELADRMLASVARVNAFQLRAGTLSRDGTAQIVEAAAKLSRGKLFVLDMPNMNVRHIGAHARRLVRKQKLALLVVDYLQLVEPMQHNVSREQQVSQSTRSLKLLAKELKIPILCLAQLNRKADDTERPRLSHLRESGAIEQDADEVLFLHRDEDQRGLVELIVAKQRSGPVATIKLAWRAEMMRFENYHESPAEASSRFDDEPSGLF